VEVQFAYAIGEPEPVSVYVNSFGTATVCEDALNTAVEKVFNFKPAAIMRQLDLLRPIYSQTTNYGHFGKIDDPAITWEKSDRIKALQRAIK